MMNEAESAELVARSAAGDARAFEGLVRGHSRQVYRWALILLADADDAEDLAQTVWITVHRSMKTFRREAKFSTWLYRITFNAGTERARTARRQDGLLAARQAIEPSAQTTETREEIDARRFESVVRAQLGHLAPRQRAIFAMADLEGISAGEIAERLEIPAVTVRTNLLKARRAMREKLLAAEPRMIEEYRG